MIVPIRPSELAHPAFAAAAEPVIAAGGASGAGSGYPSAARNSP
jgi:hypothetical protein